MHLRRKLAVLLLVAVMLTAVAPAAKAEFPIWPGGLAVPAAGNVGMTGCGPSHGAEGQGGTGGSVASACTGAGLVFIGPTIISPGFAGVVVVSNGATALGP